MPEQSQSVYLSVVIPAYNEEKNIGEALRRVGAFLSLKKFARELLIVNDGSKDRTGEIVREYLKKTSDPDVRLLESETNKGKGASVKRGVLAARGRYVLITDADLSSPIKEADKLIRELGEGYDVAIGSRAVRETDCDVQESLKRYLSGRVFNLFVRAVALSGFADTQCGFKCFKKAAAKALFEKQTLDGFAFDVEILCLARKNGYKIKEVPVMWRQGKDSRVDLFKDSLSMLHDLFYLRRRYGKC